MSFGQLDDLSQPHTILTVNHPVQLRPLRNARLGAGTYKFAGDLRPQFGGVRERRMVAQGVLSVEYVDHGQDQNLSAQTNSTALAPLQDRPTVIEPKPLDLQSKLPDDQPRPAGKVDPVSPQDPTPPSELSEAEVERAVEQPLPEEPALVDKIPGEPLPPELEAPPDTGPSLHLEERKPDLVQPDKHIPDRPVETVKPEPKAEEPEVRVPDEVTTRSEPGATVSPDQPVPPESQTVDPADPTEGDKFFDQNQGRKTGDPGSTSEPGQRRRRRRRKPT